MAYRAKSHKAGWYWFASVGIICGICSLWLCVLWLRTTQAATTYSAGSNASNNYSARSMYSAPNSPPCDPAWHAVTSPSPGAGENLLYGVSALSATNVWAAGFFRDAFNVSTPLIVHWDGNSWTVVPSPAVPNASNELYATDALTSSNIWAVGLYTDQNNLQYTLTEHWDGSNWSIVTSPNPGSVNNSLDGVAVISANDVWAVGEYNDGVTNYTLTEHWNGTSWSVVPSPTGSINNVLNAVDGTSSTDVWAVGQSGDGPIVEHWNGTAWSMVANPSTGVYLFGVSALATNNAWIVGEDNNNNTLTEHWDGTSWSVVPSANIAGDRNALRSIAVISPADIWAVGTYTTGFPDHALAEHWNGTSWTIVPTDDPPSGYLLGSAPVSSTDVWAVGYQAGGGGTATLAEHYSTLCINTSTPTPVATATGSPSTPTMLPTNTSAPSITATQTRTRTATPANSPTPTPTVTATATATVCGLNWYIVPSANASIDDSLSGVAAITNNDAWAVGWTDLGGAYYNTLAEHWDGSSWTAVPSPNDGDVNVLTSVSAISSSDIWAVGYRHTTSKDGQGEQSRNPAVPSIPYVPALLALAEHWNGSQWTIMPTADPSQQLNSLSGVVALSSNNVWAVGHYQVTNMTQVLTLVEHWDGSQWSVVASPNPDPGQDYLSGIAAVSSSDIWAVGQTGVGATITAHWNGTQWSIVPSPTPGGFSSSLNGVAARATDDVWAVGTNASNTLIIHWDGATWTAVNSPAQAILSAVVAVSATNAWAVGAAGAATLTLHWDGAAWNEVPSPNVGAFPNALNGVAAVVGTPAANILAVGQYATGGVNPPDQTLAERYFDPCANTPTATSIPASPTATSPVATATATPTSPLPTITSTPAPTVCSIQFTDVPPGSTFYSFVRCLSCMGIINGYPDGTFKPNNNVTRGQLSKIVSNAAGFSDPQPDQMFQDVPLGSPFQVYIGRLASRGYISGYVCGGAGEPCQPPTNLPYFRPSNQATRGQISKIDANAAGFSDTPSGQQLRDVPVASTYYTYTYRLVSRGVMGGYLCGGVGEPCVPPANLPYFRPNNNATRGQTSKIVSNTFFPDCNPPSR